MLNNIIFLLIIFLANIIQGITGFAGTALAMPPSLFFVDLSVAKPVLNAIGIFSGAYICVIMHKDIYLPELKKILTYMLLGMIVGFIILKFIKGQMVVQYRILGTFIFFIGSYNLFLSAMDKKIQLPPSALDIILFLSGVVHGMFVCGGPLLVVYLTEKLKTKAHFRATVSCVWVVLNSIIFAEHIHQGYFLKETAALTGAALPLLFAGLFIGNIIYKKISQNFFLNLSYILLIISGLSLFIK